MGDIKSRITICLHRLHGLLVGNLLELVILGLETHILLPLGDIAI
jgi:hypothetical protein